MNEQETHSDDDELFTTAQLDTELVVRSIEKREIEARLVPFNEVVDTPIGPEVFLPGSFAHVDAKRVVMRLEHSDPPAGRGLSIEERSDGAYGVFRISKTPRGDEILTLAQDGVTPHVSVGYDPRRTESELQIRGGKRVTAHSRVDLREVSTTWKPYYQNATVIAVRSEESNVATKEHVSRQDEPDEPDDGDEKKDGTDNGNGDGNGEPSGLQMRSIVEKNFAKMDASLSKFADGVTERLEKLEERSRQFVVNGDDPKPSISLGHWAEIALRILSGDRVADTEYRAVAEVITTDNAGVVPATHMSELIGVIDASRPFMESTRKLNTPETGLQMTVPKITQRPTVDTQVGEKDELSSQKTIITTETFSMVTKGGVGDISLQLLKRADRSFLDLYVQLLAEAYAIEAEDAALRALFNEVGGGVTGASAMDPEALVLGPAYQTSFDAIRRPPDTIWLSTEAVGAFIDAKASGTNAPLYSQLAASATAGGGITGSISGLRAVHVPGLDAHGCFSVVGPSSGFAWAEDGTYTLQVDIPSKAGRDVALVGMLWFAPWYPDAFTLYNVAS